MCILWSACVQLLLHVALLSLHYWYQINVICISAEQRTLMCRDRAAFTFIHVSSHELNAINAIRFDGTRLFETLSRHVSCASRTTDCLQAASLARWDRFVERQFKVPKKSAAVIPHSKHRKTQSMWFPKCWKMSGLLLRYWLNLTCGVHTFSKEKCPV